MFEIVFHLKTNKNSVKVVIDRVFDREEAKKYLQAYKLIGFFGQNQQVYATESQTRLTYSFTPSFNHEIRSVSFFIRPAHEFAAATIQEPGEFVLELHLQKMTQKKADKLLEGLVSVCEVYDPFVDGIAYPNPSDDAPGQFDQSEPSTT